MSIETHGRILATNKLTDLYTAINNLDYAKISKNNSQTFFDNIHNKLNLKVLSLHFDSSIEEQRSLRSLTIILPDGYDYISSKPRNPYDMFHLTLGYWGNSEKIMFEIVKQFGGLYLPNDYKHGIYEVVAKEIKSKRRN